ncbi:putative HKD family nuclease [Bacteroidales bacterium Barb6]|nr:putative HKD family nuclease [Bacteroidales bacterium Barb6]
MAKYLRTSAITSEVEDLISKAKDRLVIISPYLQLSDKVRELLENKERGKIVKVIILCGKEKLKTEELEFLQNLKCVNLYFYKDLHAKCYLNEKKMIISSMNLYEYSQKNNIEMGILIEKDIDEQIYDDAWEDIESMLYHRATDYEDIEASKGANKVKTEPSKPSAAKSNASFVVPPQPNTFVPGFCIRTGVPIPFNIEKPLSYDAYKQWNKYKDPDYPEKYCHFSGELSNGETSVSHPVLRKNWKKANN